jgi:predicted DNA-binding transcriptional regulator AlpA
MISFAIRVREILTERLLLNDAEVAALLGISRSTVWTWLDAGELPAPKRVGRSQEGTRRQRACRTLWHRGDIELFARCQSMAEYRRLKQQERG